MSCAVIEEKHVGIVLSAEVLESADDGYGVEALSFEDGIVNEFLIELMEGEWYDGSVVDSFVFFFAGVGGHLGACFNYIIHRKKPI
jgi:hypothetical protein